MPKPNYSFSILRLFFFAKLDLFLFGVGVINSPNFETRIDDELSQHVV